jgi:hypothetical protein
MIADQMLLVPRIFLHALVIFQALKDHLTEAVKIGYIGHLRIVKLRHERACSDWSVDLLTMIVFRQRAYVRYQGFHSARF